MYCLCLEVLGENRIETPQLWDVGGSYRYRGVCIPYMYFNNAAADLMKKSDVDVAVGL